MKVLMINGSPRKNGNIATLLEAVREGIGSGHEVELLHVSDLDVKPCMGCNQCRESMECVQPEDDGHRVGKKIMESDALVLGSATYWGDITGQLKVLVDRNVPVFVRLQLNSKPMPQQKGKPAIMAAACGIPWPFSNLIDFGAKGAFIEMKKILSAGGYRIIGALEQPGAKFPPEILPATLKRAKKMGVRLVS